MPLQPRGNIRRLTQVVHGGPDYAELEKLGIAPDEILDFSVSTNPAGIPSGILKPLPRKELAKYPDSNSTELVRELSRKTGVSETNILAGSGSTELIRLAVLAYAGENDRVLILEPTYGEYRTAAEIAGAGIMTYTASLSNNFRPETGKVIGLIQKEKPKIVFICNPNNPTGQYLSERELEEILDSAGNTLVVVDEAYAAFADGRWESTGLINRGNLLIIRSMTKDYSLAGLRLGYAVAAEEIISVLRKVAPPWNLNAYAQKAGIAALQQDAYLEKSREIVQKGKTCLFGELEKLGYSCVPSKANFFLVKTGDASGVRDALLGKGILVRDCTSFGLPDYIRIAPQTMRNNHRLIAALKDI